MLNFIKSLYLSERLFLILLGFVFAFILGYSFNLLFIILQFLFIFFIIIILIDAILLYIKQGVKAERLLPERLSNGDDNQVHISIENSYPFPAHLRIIDEIPFQFQIRDFLFKINIKPKEHKSFVYHVRPVERGIYEFGKLNIYAESLIGLIRRRYIFSEKKDIPVYPSFLQIKKYDLLVFTNRLHKHGVKKIRKIGNSLEFEQVKEYVLGDDFKTINWKATAKHNKFMVNHYQDEKSQPVYSIIDKGRVMLMPFNEMSLLDYAINTSLIISNVALKKGDKAGILSFSNKVENLIIAERRSTQMNRILETLYNLKTNFYESHFERLYINIKRKITQRSLLFLYTNFENMDSLYRQLPYLKAISKEHLLVVVFFKNIELKKLTENPPKSTRDIFHKVVAEKFEFDKKLIVYELKKQGILSILTEPQNLTINIINKYLELKARGLL